MTLDSASQTFNTGAPQYAASEATISIKEIRATDSGMEVVIGMVNEALNGGGFFPNYTITVTANDELKSKESDVFPDQPRELVFPFDTRAGVEVEANPGGGVESLFLSAQLPDFADIQEPDVTIDLSPQMATVEYTISNEGGQSGTVTAEVEVSGEKIETKTETAEKVIPPNTDISDSVTFEFANESPIEVQICVENNGT